MNLDAVIEKLQQLRNEHGGDVDVTAWHYGGGMEDLLNVEPSYDKELRVVVMEPKGTHDSGSRR